MTAQAGHTTAEALDLPRIQQLPPKPLRTGSRPQLRLRTRSSQLNLRHSTTRIASPLSTSPPPSRVLVFTLHRTLYYRQSPSTALPQRKFAPLPRPYLRTLLAYVLSPDTPWSKVVFWSDELEREEVVAELLMLELQLAWREEMGEIKLHGKVEAWGKREGREISSKGRAISRKGAEPHDLTRSALSTAPSYVFVDVSRKLDLPSILLPPFQPIHANAEPLPRPHSRSASGDTALLQLISKLDDIQATWSRGIEERRIGSSAAAEEQLVRRACDICGRLSITVEAESRLELDQDIMDEVPRGEASDEAVVLPSAEAGDDLGAVERLPLWNARDGFLGFGYSTSPETTSPSPLSSLSADSLSSLPDSPLHHGRRSTITPASSIASSFPFHRSKSSLRTSTLSQLEAPRRVSGGAL